MKKDFSALMEFSISPLGAGESVSSAVAAALKIVQKSGLKYELHSMGTIVEGEVPELLKLLDRCSQELLKQGASRLSLSVKMDIRPGTRGRIVSKVKKVERLLKAKH